MEEELAYNELGDNNSGTEDINNQEQEKKSSFVENKRQISAISTVNGQLDTSVLPITNNRITPKISPRVEPHVELLASEIPQNDIANEEVSSTSISEKRKMRAAILKNKIRRNSADGEIAEPPSDAPTSLNAVPTPVVGKLGLLKAKSRRNTEPKEVDDNEIHFQDDDAAPLPSIEQKPRGKKLLIQKTVISTGGQNNENDTSSSSKVRVRMTPSEIRASARHSKVPLKLPLLSNIPKPLPPQQDDAALSSRRQERSESSRDRSPRRVHEDDGMPRKKRPLYQRMIARAFRNEQLELMKKNEEYMKLKAEKAKSILTREQLRDHIRKFDAAHRHLSPMKGAAAAAVSPTDQITAAAVPSSHVNAAGGDKKSGGGGGGELSKEAFRAKHSILHEKQQQQQQQQPHAPPRKSTHDDHHHHSGGDRSSDVLGGGHGSNQNSPRSAIGAMVSSQSSPSHGTHEEAHSQHKHASPAKDRPPFNLYSRVKTPPPVVVLEPQAVVSLATPAGSEDLQVEATAKKAGGSAAKKAIPPSMNLRRIMNGGSSTVASGSNIVVSRTSPFKGGGAVFVPPLSNVPDMDFNQTKVYCSMDWIVPLSTVESVMNSELLECYAHLYPESEGI